MESNWVTTSMLRNAAKNCATLEELGWTLHPPGRLEEWDGLTRWFVDYAREHPTEVTSPYLRTWLRAARVIQRPDRGD